ncbi:MAG: hypothetical protein COA82_10380 [Alkaliphilus sp.]|nr:hypothetical protein [bacterium AH-315-K05]PHS31283.1 MAG: hypothetical protein COA82_10380 [Alkaliphilus sp.]
MSEPVETESYLLTVLRYIHQNPVKAGMVEKAENYKWSSYKKYCVDYQGQKSFVNCDVIKGYFGELEDFVNYMNANNCDECLDYNLVKKLDDSALTKIIHKEYNLDSGLESIIASPKDERNTMIRETYNIINM